MDYYVLTLRLLHIVSGVIWAGAGIFIAAFLVPASRAAGEAGGRVMGALQKTSFPLVVSVTAGLTMLSGILLFIRDYQVFGESWVQTPQGVILAVGGIAGILAGVVGAGIAGRTSARMAKLGEEMQAGKPSDAQIAEMGKLQVRMTQSSRIGAILLVITIIAMSIWRYVVIG